MFQVKRLWTRSQASSSFAGVLKDLHIKIHSISRNEMMLMIDSFWQILQLLTNSQVLSNDVELSPKLQFAQKCKTVDIVWCRDEIWKTLKGLWKLIYCTTNKSGQTKHFLFIKGQHLHPQQCLFTIYILPSWCDLPITTTWDEHSSVQLTVNICLISNSLTFSIWQTFRNSTASCRLPKTSQHT